MYDIKEIDINSLEKFVGDEFNLKPMIIINSGVISIQNGNGREICEILLEDNELVFYEKRDKTIALRVSNYLKDKYSWKLSIVS